MMLNDDIIKVDYEVYSTAYSIRKHLPKLLAANKVMSFDVETRSIYDAEQREDAKEYLKELPTSDPYYKQAMMVSNSSGLSFPSLVRTTHFIFGENINKSHIFICTDDSLELYIWGMVAGYTGKWLIHNSLFDLRICYQKVGKLPKNYDDTMLMVKGLINHVNIYKAKTSLKELVGHKYPPAWSLYNDYEPTNLKNKSFLDYCAYDTSAVWALYELILEAYSDTAQ